MVLTYKFLCDTFKNYSLIDYNGIILIFMKQKMKFKNYFICNLFIKIVKKKKIKEKNLRNCVGKELIRMKPNLLPVKNNTFSNKN